MSSVARLFNVNLLLSNIICKRSINCQTTITDQMTDSVNVVRLGGVTGHAERQNDVIFARHVTCMHPTSRVIFFGGDVQDYVEKMQAHRDNFRHADWNLESTARHVLDGFLDSEVLVVKPSRMFLSTFSCYDNFVKSSQNGAPTHASCHSAIEHLRELTENAVRRVDSNASGGEPRAAGEGDRQVPPLILIGFSKGCVVLNQLAHEMHHGRDKPEVKDFVQRVTDMYWLDSGHAGGSNVWITDPHILKSIVNTGIRVHVHVTPYQIEDCNRPWIRREEKVFSETLRRFGANVTRTLHFSRQPPSLEIHFRLLTEFREKNLT